MDLKEALDASYGGPVVETHKGNNHNAPAARIDSTPTPGRSSRYKRSLPAYTMNLGGSGVRVNPLGLALLLFVGVLFLYYTFSGGNSVGASVGKYERFVSMKKLLAVSIEMAKRGGAEVKRIRTQADIGESSKGKTREGANDPRTDGDMLSHRAMYHGMAKAFPGVSVVSEEHDPAPFDRSGIKAARYFDTEVDEVIPDEDDDRIDINDIDVWIDPLDATQEYTENLLQYVTTMVCISVKGKPVAGVIHKPFEDLTAWGWAKGARKDANFVSKVVKADFEKNGGRHPDLAKSRLIVSRSHAGEVHNVTEKVFGSGATVTPAGGAGYKAWEVVKGEQDAYVHVTLIKKWDICPGDAILRALGGKLTTLRGDDVDYAESSGEKNEGGVIATVHDHEAFVEALKDVKVNNGGKHG